MSLCGMEKFFCKTSYSKCKFYEHFIIQVDSVSTAKQTSVIQEEWGAKGAGGCLTWAWEAPVPADTPGKWS